MTPDNHPPGAGATPALAALDAAGVRYRIHHYTHAPGTHEFGAEAAAALPAGSAERMFKTLIAVVQHNRPELICALVPVTGRLDLKALAVAAGAKKAQMADAAAAQRSSGYVVGGISPLGQRRPLTTFIDASALDAESVFVSGGRRGLTIELSPVDLAGVCGARFVALGR